MTKEEKKTLESEIETLDRCIEELVIKQRDSINDIHEFMRIGITIYKGLETKNMVKRIIKEDV